MPTKGPSVFINAKDAIIYGKRMSLHEFGVKIDSLFSALEREDYEYVLSFPFVEKCQKGNCKRDSIPPSLRSKVLEVGRCKYCGSTNNLTVDHIKPVILGGTNKRRNLQCLCRTCNRGKGPNRQPIKKITNP